MLVRGLKVMKFGGTSMGSAEAIEQVISIIRKPQKDARIAAVVVSAMSGVTDQLIKIARTAAQKDESYKKLLAELERRHQNVVKKLVSGRARAKALTHVKTLSAHLANAVLGVFLVRELSPGALDYIMSYGERLSAHILRDALSGRGVKCEYLNARGVVMTDDAFGAAYVDFKTTNRNIQRYFRTHNKLQIVTGFISATPEGKTTTLGRGGSDYSAAIVGAALGAKVIEIWTDVSGVYTADPRIVREALPIATMTYDEAAEMSYFGAKVIHPPTMRPAQGRGIPILIKNTFEPASAGTLITKKAPSNGLVRGISSINSISILHVAGSGMVGMRGVAGRIFGALGRAMINAMLITQASSEHSISIAVRPEDADRGKRAIDGEFAPERAQRLVDGTVVQGNLSAIAVVGEGMRHKSGITGRLFGALGENDISVVAIAQGSSERNISIVVARKDEVNALNAIHAAFFSFGERDAV